MQNVFILGLVSFFTDISSEMIYPLIPVFLIGTYGASPIIVGLIEGISHSFGSLFKIYFGHLSDKIRHRKWFAAGGYFVSALGKLFIALSGGWGAVLWGRVIDRFGKGVRTAPRDALIVESVGGKNIGRAFGIQRALDTGGAFVGIMLGYLILINVSGDIRNVFFWALIPAGISVAIMALFVREKKITVAAPKERTKFRWKILPRHLKVFLFISFIFSLGTSSNLFLILKAISIGFVPVVVMLLYATFTLSYALIIYPASRISDAIGRKAVLVSGYFIFGLVYFAFAFVNNPLWYWALFIIYGAYLGLTDGVEKAFIVDVTPGDVKATAIGAHATIVGVMTLPASLLAGALWEWFGPHTPFYFSAAIGFLTTILILWYLPTTKQYSANRYDG